MNFRRIPVVLAVATLAVAAPLRAQARTLVTPPGGIAWGTTADAIVARRGAPESRMPDAEGVTVLSYPETVSGRSTYAIFFVHPRAGLFRFGYGAPVESVAECTYALGTFDLGVSRAYSGIEPVEQQIGDAGDPCTVFGEGRGGYMKRWDDAGGSRILLALIPGTPMVMLTYTTPAADAWERRKQQTQF